MGFQITGINKLTCKLLFSARRERPMCRSAGTSRVTEQSERHTGRSLRHQHTFLPFIEGYKFQFHDKLINADSQN